MSRQADKSLLIKAVRYTNEDLQMPPKNKKLSAEQIADLESWVKIGAPDPRVPDPALAKAATAKAENHWAFKPVKRPPLPKVSKRKVCLPSASICCALWLIASSYPTTSGVVCARSGSSLITNSNAKARLTQATGTNVWRLEEWKKTNAFRCFI